MSRQTTRITRQREGGAPRRQKARGKKAGSTTAYRRTERPPSFSSIEEVPQDLLLRAQDKLQWILRYVNLGYPVGTLLGFARDHAKAHGIAERDIPASSTLYEWAGRYKRYGLLGLVDNVRSDAGKPRSLTEEQQGVVEALLFARGDTSPARAIKLMTRAYPKQPPPSRHAVYRYRNQLVRENPAQVEFARTGRPGIRADYQTKVPGAVLPAGVCLAMDSTQPDIWCQVPSPDDPTLVEAVRLFLTVVQDIGSRMIVTFALSLLPPYPELMLGVLRQALVQSANWPGLVSVGVPDRVLVDAGSEFRGAFKQVMRTMQVELDAASGNPNHNARVERLIGSINTEVCANMLGYSRLEKPLDPIYAISELEAKRTLKDLRYDPLRLEVPVTSLPTILELEEELLAWAQHYNDRAHPSHDIADPMPRALIQDAELTRLEQGEL